MAFDLKETIARRRGENYDLHHQFVNRTLVKVLRTIGFDKTYVRAEGPFLFDEQGLDYLDFLSGYGVFNIGRNHPVVAKAIRDVIDLDLPNMVQMDCALLSGLLAEKLCSVAPEHLDAVFFCNSGTESVEGAIKFARASTQRSRILSLSGSYHGLTLGALSITNNGNFQGNFGPFLPGCTAIPPGDLNALERELKSGDVAAFIFEPVQGKGVYYPEDTFFPAAQELCRKYGALVIADEVQTGFGRTGKLFGHQHWNLEPDIITLAKALSGGYVPCAAFMTRRSIHQRVFDRLDRCVIHSTTFGRNNLAMACGLATLDVIESEQLVRNAAERGQSLLSKLEALKKRHSLIHQIRGKGLMIAIEFAEPEPLKMKLAWKAIHAADKGLFPQMIVTDLLREHRILTHVAGHNLDIVKILPPLTITETEVDRFVNALDAVLTECSNPFGSMWEFGKNLVKAAVAEKSRREPALA